MSKVSKRLPSGAWVLLRPIPPHYRGLMGEVPESAFPEEPKPPIKMVQSIAGHSEKAEAGKGDPEYEAYMVEKAAWLRECARIRKQVGDIKFMQALDFGILGWIQPGLLQALCKAVGLWRKKPPGRWKPHVLAAAIPSGVDVRAVYITSELLMLDEDYDAVMDVLAPEPLSPSEVGEQLDGFQPDSGAEPLTDSESDQGA